MKNITKKITRISTVLTASILSAALPLTALAAQNSPDDNTYQPKDVQTVDYKKSLTPEFAYSAEKWATLRDNIMEYGELADLIHEYNPTVLSNRSTYKDQKNKNLNDIYDDYMKDIDDIWDQADNADNDVTWASLRYSAGLLTKQADNNYEDAEIRGHRRTYVGAMPGRIANGLRTAGVKNPVMLLDEIDKVSTDYKGDTFSALLEVLDNEQNHKFRDHYLEVPLDLSEVLFITTANTLQTIPRPLLDRMEVIEISSYTENEKLHIAEEHLIPKQIEKHGLTPKQITFSKHSIWKIARNYTKEAGVRQLEREIGNVCRKAAKEIFTTERKKIAVTDRNIHRFLGKEKYTYQMANIAAEVGIVRGLAWTSVGGDTLQIEVNVMPGKGELMLTGQLGDVMKESARTGISYIRSVSKKYAISPDFFEKHDIHVHIPEGAVPKDGPSAGITMAVAMLSAITEKKVRADLAMTGEVTLRGRVLPIGGLKEKLLAAKSAGIKTVLVPKANQADVEELSAEITKGMEILFVESMDEVLKAAMGRKRK